MFYGEFFKLQLNFEVLLVQLSVYRTVSVHFKLLFR